jgi:RNA polymerase sigma factor (TIGR02999 family)
VTAAIDQLIRTADAGDGTAAKELFATLYRELHGLAERQLRRSGAGLTLGATTLLHEAYLAMVDRKASRFPDRGRFLAYAARAMRGLIIDYARRQRAKKRGGEFHITLVGDREIGDARSTPVPVAFAPLERLSDALDVLAQVDPALAELVDLHFFCGFSLVEIASLRGVSDRTVQRDWRKARLLLHRAMEEP